MKLLETIKARFFTDQKPLSPGTFHYQAPPEAEFPYRIHLRVEKDGNGLLILNASTILHLNQTATEFVWHMIEKTSEDETARSIARRYNVPHKQAQEDYHNLLDKLNTLITMPDLDPVTFLEFSRSEPYAEAMSAPYRLDCALTYKVNIADQNTVAPVERVKRELTHDEWKAILTKSWQAGIPHIIFTGGEPTLRPDLPELIKHAEDQGQVTGLLTNGYMLTKPHYRQQLLENGLDHLMILLYPHEDQSWEVIRDVMPEDIFTTVHITITTKILDEFESILDKLRALEVESLSLSVNDLALKDKIQEVHQAAVEREFSLVWDLPVPYSKLNPVSLEAEEETPLPDGAGRAWLYVEPDGDVLVSQGYPDVMGNILTDTWDKIWEKHPE